MNCDPLTVFTGRFFSKKVSFQRLKSLKKPSFANFLIKKCILSKVKKELLLKKGFLSKVKNLLLLTFFAKNVSLQRLQKN